MKKVFTKRNMIIGLVVGAGCLVAKVVWSVISAVRNKD